MNLKAIIDEIADQADDFLEGVSSLEQARAAISEMVSMLDVKLSAEDRTAVIDGVMAVLKTEGFFEWSPQTNELDEGEGDEE